MEEALKQKMKELLSRAQEISPDLLLCERAFAGLPADLTEYLAVCKGIPIDMLERYPEEQRSVLRYGLLSHLFMHDVLDGKEH